MKSALTGTPHSTSYSVVEPKAPSVTRPTSQLVPPMSRVTPLPSAWSRAKRAPAMTPPASPESRSCTGASPADSAWRWPPFDFMSESGAAIPALCRSVETWPTKRSMMRLMKASVITVALRSYSRQIGQTSLESETGRSGKRSAR